MYVICVDLFVWFVPEFVCDVTIAIVTMDFEIYLAWHKYKEN